MEESLINLISDLNPIESPRLLHQTSHHNNHNHNHNHYHHNLNLKENYLEEVDKAILEETQWLNSNPSTLVWRDLRDRIIDDREFPEDFRQKLQLAKRYRSNLQSKVNVSMLGSETYNEAKNRVIYRISLLIFDEIIEEIISSLVEELMRTRNQQSVDLLSKIVLNGILDIHEGNRRHLKMSGKLALLHGAVEDIATNRNDCLGDDSWQKRSFDSLKRSSVTSLSVIQSEINSKVLEEKNNLDYKDLVEELLLYNRSFTIDAALLQHYNLIEQAYVQGIQYVPIIFRMESSYGKITVTKLYHTEEMAMLGTLMISCTNLGRIMIWRIRDKNISIDQEKDTKPPPKTINNDTEQIELIAANAKPKRKFHIVDFKIPTVEPSSIITIDSDNQITIWNVRLVFEQLADSEDVNKLNQKPNGSFAANLFSCFQWQKKKVTILIEEVTIINNQDLSFMFNMSTKNLDLYPVTKRGLVQKVYESITGSQSKSGSQGEPVKRGWDFGGEPKRELNFMTFTPTTFCHYQSIGYKDGEPRSIFVATSSGHMMKLNLDFLSASHEHDRSSFMDPSHQHMIAARKSKFQQTYKSAPFVHKEFINPNLAPQGFLLIPHEHDEGDFVLHPRPLEDNPSSTVHTSAANLPKHSKQLNINQVYREVFKFHENPIVLLDVLHEGKLSKDMESDNGERILSIDSQGFMAIWKYEERYLQGMNWFLPAHSKRLNLQIIHFDRPNNALVSIDDWQDNFQRYIEKQICISVESRDTAKIGLPVISANDGNSSPTFSDLEVENTKIEASCKKIYRYYPTLDADSGEWYQIEMLEGNFIRKQRRSSVSKGNKEEGVLSGTSTTPSGSPRVEEEQEARDSTLAAKIASRFRKTMIEKNQTHRKLRKYRVVATSLRLIIQKAVVSCDSEEVVLLYQATPVLSNSKTGKAVAKANSAQPASCYYIGSILTSGFIPLYSPTRLDFLKKDESILDLAVGPITLETLSRFVFILTNKRILIISISTGVCLTNGATDTSTNPSKTVLSTTAGGRLQPLTIATVINDCHLKSNFTPQSFAVSPDQRFLTILSTSGTQVVYQLNYTRISPFNVQPPPSSLPWQRSYEKLLSLAVKTYFSPSQTLHTTGSVDTSYEEAADYAVGISIDKIIEKVIEIDEINRKDILDELFEGKLGAIYPTKWPPGSRPTPKAREKKPLPELKPPFSPTPITTTENSPQLKSDSSIDDANQPSNSPEQQEQRLMAAEDVRDIASSKQTTKPPDLTIGAIDEKKKETKNDSNEDQTVDPSISPDTAGLTANQLNVVDEKYPAGMDNEGIAKELGLMASEDRNVSLSIV
jgi:hypothetical protein